MEPDPSAKSALIVGRYALYEAIAAGGMATVHYGRLLGPVGFSRTVAIKRLHTQFARDPEFVSMFLDEARLAARIRHPNVVPTLDVVATDGELFLVMEYVPGESLAKLVRTAAGLGTVIPPRIVSAIVCGLLRGLHAAHEATNERGEPLGIVHRDVSPQNVLVGIDGQSRVLDFGVAKAAGRLQTTRDGKLKGKLAYMSPEQVSGVEVDRRTDLFSLGAALWEITCGRRLFKGGTDVETGKKVMAAEVPHPAVLLPGYPNELATIILRALSKDRALRYQTAADLGKDLDAFAASGADITPSVLLGIMRDLFPGDCDHDARWFENEAREAHTVPLQPLMLRMPPRTPTPPKPNGVHPVSAPPPAAPAPAAPPPLATRPASGATRPASPLDLLTQRELAMFGVLAVLALTAVAVAIVSLAR